MNVKLYQGAASPMGPQRTFNNDIRKLLLLGGIGTGNISVGTGRIEGLGGLQ